MRARITRIAVSFGVVLSAYVVYALVMVRFIEPSVKVLPQAPLTAQQVNGARNLSNQAALQLRPYFPKGSWELKDPKILGNDRVKLLVKDYSIKPGGILELKPRCTLLFFEEVEPGKPKPPPVILQAPEGATLRFEGELDAKRLKIGRLIGGEMNGRITIRRQPSHPGASDDLEIITHDIKLLEDRIVTPALVDFRYGRSYGSGRDMTILLDRGDAPGAAAKSPAISGVKSLTLARDVEVHMITPADSEPKLPATATATPLPAAAAAAPTPPKPANAMAAAVGAGSQPPVKVTCRGPFCFDVEHAVATFSEKVDVFRLNASGPSDEMNCELLAIHFARREEAAAAPAAKATQRRASGGAPALEARWIEARGDPVIIRAPSQGAQVRGQRVEYDLKTGRIVVDGPGTLQGSPTRNPSGRYAAQWSHQLRVDPLVGEQLVTLMGGARVSLSDVGSRTADGAPQSGTLWADEIRAWLTDPPQVSVPGEPQETRPKRVLAQGAVRVESSQLIGATGQLDAIFVPSPPLAAGEAAAPEKAGGAAGQNHNQRSSRSEQQFNVAGSKMEIHLAVRGSKTEVSELFLDGKAMLAEAKTAKPEDKPLLVNGDRLEVLRADALDTRIVVIGKPGKVEARGLSLAGPEIQLERATNLLWIDGPGRMTAPAPVDPAMAAPGAKPAAAARLATARTADPGNLDITWTGRMQFDGHLAHFEKSVLARTTNWLVRTETLDASLQRTIDFAHPPDPNSKADPAKLEQLVCTGGPRGRVEVENRSTDENGLLSIDRMEAPDLALNGTTGGIDAHGPGWVSTVRRGMASAARTRLPQAGSGAANKKPASPNPTSDRNALSYIAVQYARSISGNMYKRELTFANQVKCIYGPVPAWEAKLDVENPDQAGPDAMTLTCDALTVREAPGRQAKEPAFMELETLGNTQADGMGIVARSHRLTFSEQKSLMVLEGDGNSDASVFRQEKVGGPRSHTAAGRILFWTSTQRVEVADGRFIDLGAMPASSAPGDGKSTKK